MNQEIQWHDHEGEVIATENGFDVIDCTCCGFRHIVPIPTVEELTEVYSHDYYSVEKPLYIERVHEDQPWWRQVYDERLNTLEDGFSSGSTKRILDVGCGPGYFLARAAERGWVCQGVEPSRQAAAHARSLGLDVVESFLSEELVEELGDFDAIHMNLVLEHIPEPTRLLATVRRLLRPGGVICVVVPNDFNPFQQVLEQACDFPRWWIAPPHHINYFSQSSLRGLLERCGFEVFHAEASFPIDLFLLMGDNYVGNDALGRSCHQKRKQFEMALELAGKGDLKRELYQNLAELDLGREVCQFARLSMSSS